MSPNSPESRSVAFKRKRDRDVSEGNSGNEPKKLRTRRGRASKQQEASSMNWNQSAPAKIRTGFGRGQPTASHERPTPLPGSKSEITSNSSNKPNSIAVSKTNALDTSQRPGGDASRVSKPGKKRKSKSRNQPVNESLGLSKAAKKSNRKARRIEMRRKKKIEARGKTELPEKPEGEGIYQPLDPGSDGSYHPSDLDDILGGFSSIGSGVGAEDRASESDGGVQINLADLGDNSLESGEVSEDPEYHAKATTGAVATTLHDDLTSLRQDGKTLYNDATAAAAVTRELEDERDAMMDYSQANPVNRPPPRRIENDDKPQPQTLGDLEVEDLKDQVRYFHLARDLATIGLHEMVRCLVCAEVGHMAGYCPKLRCESCNAYKEHFNHDCPLMKRCSRCRERGHALNKCPHKLKTYNLANIKCDLCGRGRHEERDCELIWRTSGRPWETEIPRSSVSFFCYECGNSGHLGNDCPKRQPNKPKGSSSWSLEVNSIADQNGSSSGGFAIKGRAVTHDTITISDDEDGHVDEDGDAMANLQGKKKKKNKNKKDRLSKGKTNGSISIARNMGVGMGARNSTNNQPLTAQPTSTNRSNAAQGLPSSPAYYSSSNRQERNPATQGQMRDSSRGNNYGGNYHDSERTSRGEFERGYRDNRFNNGYTGGSGPQSSRRRSLSPLPPGGGRSRGPPYESYRPERMAPEVYRPMPSAAGKAWKAGRM